MLKKKTENEFGTLEITQGKQIVRLMDLLMSFHAKTNFTLDTAQILSFPGLISII